MKETLNENFILDAMGIVLVGAVGLYGTAYAAAYAYDRVVTGADKLASVMTKVNNKLEMNKLAKIIEPIVERFKTDTQLQDMYKALPKYAVDRTGVNTDATRKQNNERNKQLAKIATYIKSKLQPEELKYFSDISKSLRSSTVTESKIDSAKLKQIIREEVSKVLTEVQAPAFQAKHRDNNLVVAIYFSWMKAESNNRSLWDKVIQVIEQAECKLINYVVTDSVCEFEFQPIGAYDQDLLEDARYQVTIAIKHLSSKFTGFDVYIVGN